MTYVALYRKYRSQSFDELMGQESVTRTLQNAIKSGRIMHSYLFHGARGCGKTSTARLLARALNCIAQDGPTPEPCGQCRLCQSIRDGACMDVIEMDAASETGIDDVREKIIENVQYAPGEARYKVYIIDEVHDLSAKAFDALLKTLEEPPAHVVFILATTELHKVPITISSRCQRYQFKRGTLHDLAAAVQRVLEAEGYTAEPEAVQAIARSAEGSWRDALSLLEQVLAYSEGHVTAETVHQAIGTVGAETLLRVMDAVARGCWDETLALAAELVDSGKDVRQLLTALSGHLRDLLLISAGAKQAAAQELGAERLAQLTPQAVLFEPPALLAMLGELAKAEREIRFTNNHRWLLESTLLRLMVGRQVIDQSPGIGRVFAPTSEARSPRTSPPLAATPTVVPKPSVPAVSRNPEPSLSADEEESDAESDLEADDVTATLDELEETLTRTQPAAPTPLPAAEETPAASPEVPAASRYADAMTLDVVQRAWPRVLKLFQKASPQGIPFLSKAQVAALEGKTVVLIFTDSFARDRIHNNAKGRAKVEATINQALNTEGYKIRCELMRRTDGDDSPNGNLSPTGGPAPSAPSVAEMPTLLDAPPPTPAATRIADFELPADVPPAASTTHKSSKNGADKTLASSPTTPAVAPQEPNPPSGQGLLAETLELFGGEVVRSERMTNDA
jgi:DNA polymerase-3 subunit gamma/tau